MYENEVKFIVRWNETLETDLKNNFISVDIEQAYLNDRARLRKKRLADIDEHIFTYKQRLSGGRNIEIETLISAADYSGLLAFATTRLSKTRVTIQQDEIRWDIDFPHWRHGKYFIVAEAEMPEHMEYPNRVLKILQPHIVLAVPRSDRRFTARRLSDESHAIGLAYELGLSKQ